MSRYQEEKHRPRAILFALYLVPKQPFFLTTKTNFATSLLDRPKTGFLTKSPELLHQAKRHHTHGKQNESKYEKRLFSAVQLHRQ